MSNIYVDDVYVDDVEVDVKQLMKTTSKLATNERLPITINVYKPYPYQSRDSYYYNPIKVRYPNLGRKKGDYHELEYLHRVWCLSGCIEWNGRNYYTPLPQIDVIDALVANYQQYGDVTLFRDDLWEFRNQSEGILVYPDNSKYDVYLNKIEG